MFLKHSPERKNVMMLTFSMTDSHLYQNLKCHKCPYLLYAGLLIFRAVAELWNSGKSAKCREIHKNTQNATKFGRNLIKYMSVQQFWNLSQLLGVYLLAVNSQIYVKTSSLKHANKVPKLLGIDYVAKNWQLATMLKALPWVHFWSVLLLKEQMMTSVRKH